MKYITFQIRFLSRLLLTLKGSLSLAYLNSRAINSALWDEHSLVEAGKTRGRKPSFAIKLCNTRLFFVFSILAKKKNFSNLFYIICPVRTSAIRAFHNYQSFVTLWNICALTMLRSLWLGIHLHKRVKFLLTVYDFVLFFLLFLLSFL